MQGTEQTTNAFVRLVNAAPYQCHNYHLSTFNVTAPKKSNEKSPDMIGPIFVHMRKDFSTYHFFTSALVSLNPEIAHLHAYGTDGETALVKALAATFPKAKHLRCFLHFKGNVEHKLRELGIPLNKEIIDIMGRASYLQYGLVDAKILKSLK